MLKCLQCGAKFYEPIKCSSIVPEDMKHVEHWNGCPRCKSDEWVQIHRCLICDADVSEEARYECLDGSVYCPKCCSYHDD
jgi:hypothetical protein